jgi:hypothetical protein
MSTLEGSADYQLRQSTSPGLYFLDRINYPMDRCSIKGTEVGLECDAIFPPSAGMIDKESMLRGMMNRSGEVLRDSLVPTSSLLTPARPFELPQQTKAPDAPRIKFRGSLRGETTSLYMDRIGSQWLVDGFNLQTAKCILPELNNLSRTGMDTRNMVKDGMVKLKGCTRATVSH